MSRFQQLIVKHTEFVLVIIGACVLSVGFVMGPGLLSAIQEKTSVTTNNSLPDRVSGASASRTVAPEIIKLPVIPAKRVQSLRPPPLSPRAASRITAPKTATPKPEISSPPRAAGFSRVLYSVAQGTRMHGEDVRRLQIRLMTVARVDLREGGDGWFGPRTADGVRKFQGANGLPANSVVDRRTWDTLFSAQARRFSF